MKSNENYFGIKKLQESSVSTILKQQLAEILFISPEVSVEEASLFVKNYITDDSVKKLITRLNKQFEEFMILNVMRQVNMKSVQKMKYWLNYFNYPNYEEIIIVARRLKLPEERVIMNLEIALFESDTRSLHIIDYLQKFSNFLSDANIDGLLDYYNYLLTENEKHYEF